MNREVKPNQLYRHFKGTIHKIICIAKDSETLEDMVVYTHDDDSEIWVRPLAMFLSEVDHEKYPDVLQKYRFELIEETD
ncbi:MAG: DUF1653 domain-containing protein [Bacilli bacterium]|nr:DUF1653 domain-containing protein [Bacilli bacterium]